VIRTATEADTDPICAALTRAFLDDPVATFCLPSERRRPRQLHAFYRGRMRTLLRDELVFCDDEQRGAALWAAPDRWQVPLRELVANPSYNRRTPLVLWGFARLDRLHPRRPHFYLSVLGVSPDAQGLGLGSRLIRPMLDRCDHEGVGAYLESSKAENLPFYERHGFQVTDELTFPRGPRLWTMWRDPR
jgi:ribosomal protein S18 acetylase RimI-like enzyme